MPSESYKYVPLDGLRNLMLEFRLNPFAFFTSGYTNDTNDPFVADWTQMCIGKIPTTLAKR